MRIRFAFCAVTMLLAATPQAGGVLGTIDPVPGATLLLPYFEADTLFNQSPYDYAEKKTVFTITNVTGSAVIAHVMLFTNYGIPTVCFDAVLPAYGSRQTDLAAVFGQNALELGIDTPTGDPSRAVTANALFQDGFETGDLSTWSSSEARVSFETLQAYHTGNLSPRTNRCAGEAYWDEVARGYVLVDVMNVEGAGFPDETGYFVSGGTGKASNTNALTGDYVLEDNPNNFSHGNSLIAVEAGSTSLVTKPGQYTFYARYVAASAADNREPLGTQWQGRFLEGGAFSGGTSVLYWRDPKSVASPLPYGHRPSWYPLNQAEVSVRDDSGNLYAIVGLTPFPLACGRVGMNSPELPGIYNFGWFFVDFNNVNSGLLSTTCQGVIAVVHDEWGRYSVGQYGIPLDNASDYNP